MRINCLHIVDLLDEFVQIEFNHIIAETRGQAEERASDSVKIHRTVGAGAIGGDFGVARPGKQFEGQSRARAGAAVENKADRDIVMLVDVVAEFVPHHKLEFIFFESFEQARGKHYENFAVFRFKAGSVEARAAVDEQFQMCVNSQKLGAFVGHFMHRRRHRLGQPH